MKLYMTHALFGRVHYSVASAGTLVLLKSMTLDEQIRELLIYSRFFKNLKMGEGLDRSACWSVLARRVRTKEEKFGPLEYDVGILAEIFGAFMLHYPGQSPYAYFDSCQPLFPVR